MIPVEGIVINVAADLAEVITLTTVVAMADLLLANITAPPETSIARTFTRTDLRTIIMVVTVDMIWDPPGEED